MTFLLGTGLGGPGLADQVSSWLSTATFLGVSVDDLEGDSRFAGREGAEEALGTPGRAGAGKVRRACLRP